jgi:hypothetical protein
MRERGLVHLHNHFASSSGTVAMLAAELGGFTFSLRARTGHWAPVVASGRKFCAPRRLISHFCRSQVLIWTPVERWDACHRALRG